MSRPALRRWRLWLSPIEKREIADLELRRKEMYAKIRVINKARNLIRMRASRRAARDGAESVERG